MSSFEKRRKHYYKESMVQDSLENRPQRMVVKPTKADDSTDESQLDTRMTSKDRFALKE